LHNLKNIDVDIPRNKLTVVTGLSGSGKSSLAFDTLYAEGQRRYIESLSSYARQFMGKLNKPDVDDIIGISPAIAIEQKINITNPRSTVGTKSEIYDYLKLLFARIGKTYSPETGKIVKRDDNRSVINYLKKFKVGSKLVLSSPIKFDDNQSFDDKLKIYAYQGFARIFYDNTLIKISDIKKPIKNKFGLVIQRILINEELNYLDSLASEIDLAFYEGKGECEIIDLENLKIKKFSNNFSDKIRNYTNPNIHLFSFNNPFGACKKCQGYGDIIGIDPDLVVPDKSISIYENAISPWKGVIGKRYMSELINNAYKFDFPIHKPYFKLNENQKKILWQGNSYFKGINHFFEKIERKNYKIQNRVLLSRYRGKTICDNCNGNRLKKETEYIRIGDKSINDLVNLSLDELLLFFKKLKLTKTEKKISNILIYEIESRLTFLNNIGLNYLNLNRRSNSLSGGESQRINIASSLGSSLIGSIYILDEPSIGLHSKDNLNLIEVLKNLKNLGNTVVVVEHDEDIMKSADYIIDMGPKAGSNGGYISCKGSFNDVISSNTLTSKYLNGSKSIKIPKKRRKSGKYLKIIGARENNLKNINVKIPLNTFTSITGVSGSGKSTLVKKILYPAMLNKNGIYNQKPGEFNKIETNFKLIEKVEYIDQNPIGRSSRSNPVTYVKAYDDIRSLFANQQLSKSRNLKPKHFSFNVDGGRCESCLGEGTITIEMQFMADVKIKCESCNGKRFKKEIIEITYKNNTIDDLLNMTISESISFFEKNNNNKISKKLKPLKDVGLGYIKLGQSSSTLSGGEAQRIKLASFLNKGLSKEKIIFIFDEPTTGLHFHDIKKLLKSFKSLIKIGHSIIVVEHNLDLIKCSDYIIDLGPEGGNKGGYIVAQGTPEEIVQNKKSHTGRYLKNKIKN
jgi:excinuclease ABC subunit A